MYNITENVSYKLSEIRRKFERTIGMGDKDDMLDFFFDAPHNVTNHMWKVVRESVEDLCTHQ